MTCQAEHTARRTLRSLLLALLAAATLAACGDDGGDDAATGPDETTTTAPGDDEVGDDEAGDDIGGGGGGAGDHPCDAVAADLVAEAFPGEAFGPPDRRTGTRGVNDVEWETTACRWESDTLEVRAAVAGPDDFADGFVCAEPITITSDETLVEVEGLGDQAWWTVRDFVGIDAHLAVCQGELRIDVDLDVPEGVEADEAALLEGAKQVAAALL